MENKFKPFIIGGIVILVLLLLMRGSDRPTAQGRPKVKDLIVPIGILILGVLLLIWFPWVWFSWLTIALMLWAAWEIYYYFTYQPDFSMDPTAVPTAATVMDQPIMSGISEDPGAGRNVTDIV